LPPGLAKQEENMNSVLIGILSGCFGLLIGLASMLFSFVKKRQKDNVEKLRLEKEILQLEIEKEKVSFKRLEAENRKYDNEIKNLEDTGHSNLA
jgi:hypothetical protein